MTAEAVTLFEERRVIHAPPDVVFELLCTPEGLRAWIATTAEVDARPGGRIAWTHENGDRMVGHIVELVAPRRLVFTYGWSDGAMGVAADSTRVEITLTNAAGGTELHLRHEGLPAGAAERHAEGWRYFLGRLAAAASDPQAEHEP